ncbi:MAG: hypothetical protein EOP92_10680 [Lysobacteraceae bacterium]|nr:MAG: hypothetical protein EOP92_10680 [Xanthomonadaceae bacterium]
MSPRRLSTSGEDSILAMLEREPARKRGKGASGARLAWHGAGAAVALALTGALVWMAANNDGLRPEVQDTVLAEAGTAPHAHAEAEAAGATIVQVAMAPVAAALDARPRSSAVIVDQPPAGAAPPLRLLKPAPNQPTPAAQAAPPLTAAPVAAPALTRAVARSAPPPAVRPAAAVPGRPKPVTAAKNTVRPAQARAQRSVNPARPADVGVDADVALISAVIVHANGHAPEGSQMTELLCQNDNCQARPPRQ